MKVSLNTVKQYIDFELPPVDELVERINAQLGGVEEVIDLADKYKDAKIVKVVECEKHPNADRLSVTKIDDGSGELIQVVCGAPNVHADMWAVWLPPESIVPATYDDAEPFKLGARELRGVMSHGMLAASDELALGSDHEGILEIDPNEWKPSDVVIEPGVSFANVYGLDDTIIDIENKMFTHRPDLFGQLGVAREIAGIFGHQFKSPGWYSDTPQFENREGLGLEVFNEASEKVPRFMAVAMNNVTIKPSPVWLQCALVAMGSKPINNIVDVTNYVMLLTAQPTHAYDYDKIRGGKIGARMAKKGEKITLLNDKAYELTEDDIVIADAEGPIGLGGIMGGGESEVDEHTKNIVLEVATFDMYAVRKSSMRHGVFTDALTRFNKGQSPLQNDHILNLLMMSVKDVSSAEQASEVYDLKDENLKVIQHDKRVTLGNGSEKEESIFSWGSVSGVIVFENAFVNDRLGLKLSPTEICDLLRNVEVNANEEPEPNTPNQLEVIAPFWRTDLELPEDIVEEVGRLYGFDKLPRELPTRSASPASQNAEIVAKQKLRRVLARAGGNEVLTYSFVHENILKKAGQDASQAFKLANALSPDLQYYRLSMLPSLLDRVHMNIRAGHGQFMLYEIGKAHHAELYDDDKLPQEFGRVAAVYAHKRDDTDSAYYQAKRTLEYMVESILPGATVTYTRLDRYEVPGFKPFLQLLTPFDPVRTAIVEINGKLAGVVGEFRMSVRTSFKLPMQTGGFEMFISPFTHQVNTNYAPLSRYPSLQRDVSYIVTEDTDYAAVCVASDIDMSDSIRVTEVPVAIYQANDSGMKTITLRYTITPYDKTLSAEEASTLVQMIVDKVIAATGARVE